MQPFRALFSALVGFYSLTSAIPDEVFGPYDYGFDTAITLKRQTTDRVVVSRLPSINGSVPLRNEIRQMKQDVRKWNLYLLALSMMQNTDQDQELSWYQITGIHGVPFVPWNGVLPADGGHGGYCTHMSVLFPTWHRPYLALYEQILFHLAQRIASWFPDPRERALYEIAAADFRIPYWDWALAPTDGNSVFLDEFLRRGISVYGPNGQQLIANPLFSYRFRPLDRGVFDWGDFPHWTETKRAPDGNISRNDRVKLAIDRVQPNLRDRLYNLFTNYPEFGPFSNKHWSEETNVSGYDSLESLHDEIHIEVGDGGHLYFIQYSAFDPIFFLHHTMIDRVLSLWQVLHPETWVPEQVATSASFTIGHGTLMNATTSLAPFFANANGTFWDSQSARYTEAFGYSYAEVIGMNGPADPRRARNNRARLSATINQLYGSSRVAAMLRNRKRSTQLLPGRGWFRNIIQEASEYIGSKTATAVVAAAGAAASCHTQCPENSIADAGNMHHYTEWLANMSVENGAMNGSFSVSLFFGAAPEDFRDWKLASNLVGTMGVFTMSDMVAKGRVSGTVPLTSYLLEAIDNGSLAGLGVVEAQRHLRQTLQFRVSGPGGEVDPSSVAGLCIEIASSEVTTAGHSWELPRWSSVVTRFTMFC